MSTRKEAVETKGAEGFDIGPEPFRAFAASVRPQSPGRARITAATRRSEPDCVAELIGAAAQPDGTRAEAVAVARRLVTALRGKSRGSGVEALMQEYALSSAEGVALMCLAEALLRIPDAPTRDRLIRDKIAPGDWARHLGHSPSPFVNAATWGLVVTGKLTGTSSEAGLAAALTRLIGRGGEPLIRLGLDLAMRMLGEQFVCGQTIGEALARSRRMEAKGFRYSYDMLGEAAATAADAARYLSLYQEAIQAIGQHAAGGGVHERPGISIKLSALHPRYARSQAERVEAELLPGLLRLAHLARSYNIGLNIDAEESDRLDLSLDLLEALCIDPGLAGWNGIGFVVQAYSKRCLPLIDHLVGLAQRTSHRLMVRLVKGAYWDSEIKRAQIAGLEFPVFTRKVHTDVSYLAAARALLGARDAIFPQFATHNAATLAAVLDMAGPDFRPGDYEFQCLHGMGEPLYEEVVGPDKLDRPCRIYAPVGTHETLLAYLVRRLLENGANTSFVNRVADETVPIHELVADPVESARAIQPPGSPHPAILASKDLFRGRRPNSRGLDLADESELARFSSALLAEAGRDWHAAPLVDGVARSGETTAVRNPADRRDIVGEVVEADPEAIAAALAIADAAAACWAAVPAVARSAILERAADLVESRMPSLTSLLVREAGKTLPSAIGEVREAADFLRYYAAESRGFGAAHRPLGPVLCISPWNFPLAIFTGQVAASLAAGNTVLAKPAEETPLVAAESVRLLHEAGVPPAVLQLLPGAGEVGAALVRDDRVQGVVFTGSTEVAQLIARQLADRLTRDGRPVPFIAETGGQNAMVVDSSALAEQVVADVIASAFDSAGQRCSALRILCLQEDVAEPILTMLRGAMAELTVGNADRLSTDIGPVISAEAARGIEKHVAAMRGQGRSIHEARLDASAHQGTFVAPTLIEIEEIGEVEREVFGPVLHVLRYRRRDLGRVLEAINATGYGLTFGLHTRSDETIAEVTRHVAAGNLYVNRNMIGAVVGVQPFGGRGLSGTGPKAGGPLYLGRLLAVRPHETALGVAGVQDMGARVYSDWLAASGHAEEAARVRTYLERSPLGAELELDGPVGERNLYSLHPRGRISVLAETRTGLLLGIGAALATGNAVTVQDCPAASALESLPASLFGRVERTAEWREVENLAAILVEGNAEAIGKVVKTAVEADGLILPVHAVSSEGLATGREDYPLDRLLEERHVSINTAAAGGNASLMSVG
ncbi:MAG TPA: trifunctional transcriptional regulator/proline dehydrogenase/L-glutamate gamma-semialdehyde dehydrogenase [Enterovirga sp.]